MSKKYAFPSYKVAIDAGIDIVSAFCIPHEKKYSYHTLEEDLLINSKTGDDVLLTFDNDRIISGGTNTGIWGTPRYMAPEVVIGGKVSENI